MGREKANLLNVAHLRGREDSIDDESSVVGHDGTCRRREDKSKGSQDRSSRREDRETRQRWD